MLPVLGASSGGTSVNTTSLGMSAVTVGLAGRVLATAARCGAASFFGATAGSTATKGLPQACFKIGLPVLRSANTPVPAARCWVRKYSRPLGVTHATRNCPG